MKNKEKKIDRVLDSNYKNDAEVEKKLMQCKRSVLEKVIKTVVPVDSVVPKCRFA